MKSLNVLLLGVILLGLSFLGLSTGSVYVQILINTTTPYIYARVALVAALLLYAFVPSIRLFTTRALVGASGITMLLAGLISIGSPSLLGLASSYMLPGDSLTLILAGILAIVLSAELSAQRTRFMANAFGYIKSQLASRPKSVAHAKTANRPVRGATLAQYLQIDNAANSTSNFLRKNYTTSSKMR